jgi:hypothetical protein
MAKSPIMFCSVSLLCLTCSLISAAATSLGGSGTVGISIVIENAAATGSYTAFVDGRAVKAPAKLLDQLGDLVTRRGREAPVAVLIHESVPIGRLGEVIGMVQKAGFIHVQCFYFQSDKRFMSPISFGRAVPFSTQVNR